MEKNLQKEAANETPLIDVLEKAATELKAKRRNKVTQSAVVSLEAH
jgi:hypothetical protein